VLVPSEVVQAVCARWPDRGQTWVVAVDAEFAELCRRYRARPVEVFKARYGFVVSVETAEHRSLVLKSTPDPDGALQATAAGQLAELTIGPPVHEVVESSVGTWTVMDLVQPGTHAIRSSSLGELADLFRLLATGPRTSEYPPISSWLRKRLLDGGAVDLPPGVPIASAEVREQALPILENLVADECRSFCHGDISSGNVLRGRHGLQLIDPRAVSGDIEYDVAVLALKSGAVVRDVAQQCGVNEHRAEMWAAVAVAARV
jgi:streptomycin 6-kinase